MNFQYKEKTIVFVVNVASLEPWTKQCFFFPEKKKILPEKIFYFLPEKFQNCPRKNLENCPRRSNFAREKIGKFCPRKNKLCPRKKYTIFPVKIQKIPKISKISAREK